jgi:prepilin-type N-terminal cleavage/methylation domain-containing protein
MDKLCRRAVKGFTLIELMIVVAIIGILAAIAIPKFADLMTKSKESAVKGSLASLRSAVSIYYSDTEGIFPGDVVTSNGADFISDLTTNGKYLNAMPSAAIPSAGGTPHTHAKVSGVVVALDDASTTARWLYTFAGALSGHVAVNCTATDSKGQIWSTW